jgi:hypothetical protein
VLGGVNLFVSLHNRKKDNELANKQRADDITRAEEQRTDDIARAEKQRADDIAQSLSQKVEERRKQEYYTELSIEHDWDEEGESREYLSAYGNMTGPGVRLTIYQGFPKSVKTIYQENGKLIVARLPVLEAKSIDEMMSKQSLKETALFIRPYLPAIREYGNKVFSVSYLLYEDLIGNKQLYMGIFVYNKRTKKVIYQETLNRDELAVANISTQLNDESISIAFTAETASGKSIEIDSHTETFYSEDDQHLQELKNEYLPQYEQLLIGFHLI